MRFETKNGVLFGWQGAEQLKIEGWGKDSLRVRSTMLTEFETQDWALVQKPEEDSVCVELSEEDHIVGDGTVDKQPVASITNGRLKAVVNFRGVITFYRDGEKILREYYRSYDLSLIHI